jgi:tRNA threonylcarbamoyladenosine biosynthesis protein TsaB
VPEAAPAELTLALDASTYVGTVAVLRDASVLAEGEAAMRGEREERLMPAVAAALRTAGAEVRDVGRLVCGAGPGSFTSLRIAAAIAKGLATASRRELLAVPSLFLIVAGARHALPPGLYLATLNAMRGDSYVLAVRVTPGGEVEPAGDWELLGREALEERRRQSGARLIGPDEELGQWPHARGVALAGAGVLREVDLDSWEPDYGRRAEAQARWEAAHGQALPRT